MKEKEFLKEHPSLKHLVFKKGDINYYFPIKGCHFVEYQDIHKTQLDKQKVRDAICNELAVGHGDKAIRILKELGL